MGERRGTKALELWCRRITEGYPGVNVQNMTTSWRDGLAFCAMIHHFRPDLIDFNSLNKDDVYGNNELAFRTAEQHLGIPALLDAEDMASCSVPDRLSILTYLSQFYQTFGGSSPSRLAMNRTTETTDERITPVPESPKPKVGSRLGMRRDPCAACGLPVFLAEKLVVARTPYHRTCFRCARCNNQLTPGNYYETEEGQYCCETCPDEESSSPSMHQKYNEEIISGGTTGRAENAADITSDTGRYKSLSDEEKTSRRVLDYNPGKRLNPQDPSVPDLIAQTSQLRLNFMTSHLLSERTAEASAVDGSFHDDSTESVNPRGQSMGEGVDSAFPDDDENDQNDEREDEENEENEENEKQEGQQDDEEEINSSTDSSMQSQDREEVGRSGGDMIKTKKDVYNALDDKLGSKRNEEQQVTAISFHDVVKDKSVNIVSREDDTKELLGQAVERGDADRCLSLVQKRLRMFEAQDKKDHADRKDKERKTDVVMDAKLQTKERSGIGKSNEDLDVDLEASEILKVSSTVQRNNAVASPSQDSVKLSKTCTEKQDANINRIVNAKLNVSRISGTNNIREERSDKTSETAVLTSEKSVSLPADKLEDAASIDAIDESNKEPTPENSTKETSLTTVEGIDLSSNEDYPEDLNPFNTDEEEKLADKCHATMDTSAISKTSTNPFESEEEDEENEEEVVPPKPAARSNLSTNIAKQQLVEVPTKRRLAAPQINLNPFWSDEDDRDSDLECRDKTPGNVPIPKPRTIKRTPEFDIQRKTDLYRSGLYASNSSITSSESATTSGGTYRKKKPAPPPPTVKELFPPDQRAASLPTSYNNSPGRHGTSPRTTPRARKTKPAPPIPMSTSTPYNVTTGAPLNFEESSIPESHDLNNSHNMWEDEKTNKDEMNRNRQSLTNTPSGESIGYKSYSDKSVQGKWKRKKGPAPPRPTPHRRKIKVMSMKDVKLELDEIELQQQGLERQGVRLEQLIRDKCESGVRPEDSSLGLDVEELVLELFALVNEKNELFRRQAELMLLRRQQRLEEEHAEVEYQIRCLMSQPEATKTDFNKQREEVLIQRLIEIVERRNEIVECLEMDRRREVEEDRSIHKHMGLFAARNKNEISGKNNNDSQSSKTRKGKTKEKTKERKSKKTPKKDADKDVDEAEVKLKRHNKRKWF